MGFVEGVPVGFAACVVKSTSNHRISGCNTSQSKRARKRAVKAKLYVPWLGRLDRVLIKP